MDEKPLRICFDKVDGFIKIYYGTRNLVLLGPKVYEAIYDRIRYPQISKVALHIVLILILQEVKLIHIILYFFTYKEKY